MKLSKYERNSKIIMRIENLDYWKPNINKIAKELELPFSTINDFYIRLKIQNRIKLWVQVITEEEEHIRFLEKHLEEKRAKKELQEED